MAKESESESIPDTEVLVPQLSEFGITEQHLATAIRVLDAIASLGKGIQKRQTQEKKGKSSHLEQVNESGGITHNDQEEGVVLVVDNDDEDEDGVDDGLAKYRQPNLRQFRKSLDACLSLHQKTMYEGKTELEHYQQRLGERSLKRQKIAEKAQQRKYVAATELRRGRVDRLERLREESKEEEEAKFMSFLVPDGHVDTTANSAMMADKRNGVKMLDYGKNYANNDDALINEQDNGIMNKPGENTTIILPKLRSCYSCKVRFRKMHHFYDQLCTECAPLNYAKRHQTADMSNKVAVVTGSRVKIGYQVCLKLLRAGATIVATTRFPNNAVAAYRNEKDFHVWKERLHVYGLDLRDVTGLEAFTQYLKIKYGHCGIDVLINNACQTVRRPRGYYMPLVQREGEIWMKGNADHRNLLKECIVFERIRRKLVIEHSTSDMGQTLLLDSESPLQEGTSDEVCDGLVTKHNPTRKHTVPFESTGISHSAAMSQIALVAEDVGINEKVMPRGLTDINGQQLDLRTTNSWLLKMDQVSTPEIMECMFVNAIAPFVLNSRLKPLMEAPMDDPNRRDRYIINVSAMEGKFYRYKMPNHPHTNMAKAALNMLTRTSSEDLAHNSRIFMNSVDTGWINDENPLEKAAKIAETNIFQTPIDEIDAAARILDPVFVGLNLDALSAGEKKKDYGKFFKDYKESEW